MARDDERARARRKSPIVGGLPDVPGIGVGDAPDAGARRPPARTRRRAARRDLPGRDASRAHEREMLATAVSAGERLLLLHGLARRARHGRCWSATARPSTSPLLDAIKAGSSEGFDPKMQALLHIARTVRRDPRGPDRRPTSRRPRDAGATDADVQLAVLIASAFSMYNRLVDGFRARTPPNARGLPRRAPARSPRTATAHRPTSPPPQQCCCRAWSRLKRRRLLVASRPRRSRPHRRRRGADRSTPARPDHRSRPQVCR